MKLKEITFIFENCDSITVDGKYIGDFLVDDIHTTIRRTACNSIDKMDIANVVAIEIHRDANKERYEFGVPERNQMTFDRFAVYSDITSIEIELESNFVEKGESSHTEHYSYFVNWVGKSDETNDAQKHYISKEGNLYIVISESKGIEDFFDKENIDDSEYMDFVFSMYDVGDR